MSPGIVIHFQIVHIQHIEGVKHLFVGKISGAQGSFKAPPVIDPGQVVEKRLFYDLVPALGRPHFCAQPCVFQDGLDSLPQDGGNIRLGDEFIRTHRQCPLFALFPRHRGDDYWDIF